MNDRQIASATIEVLGARLRYLAAVNSGEGVEFDRILAELVRHPDGWVE